MLEQTERKRCRSGGAIIDGVALPTPSWHSACEFFGYLGLMPIQILLQKPHDFYKKSKDIVGTKTFCSNKSSIPMSIDSTSDNRNKDVCNDAEHCDTPVNNLYVGAELVDVKSNICQPTTVKVTRNNNLYDKGSRNKPHPCYGDTDEEELPTILPPKRRRLCTMYTNKSPLLVEDQTERLSQEFPKHNWLEQKIAQQLRILKDYEDFTEEVKDGDSMIMDFQSNTPQGDDKSIHRKKVFSRKERKKKGNNLTLGNTSKDFLKVHKCKKLTIRLKCLRESSNQNEKRKYDEEGQDGQISAANCDKKKKKDNTSSNKMETIKTEAVVSPVIELDKSLSISDVTNDANLNPDYGQSEKTETETKRLEQVEVSLLSEYDDNSINKDCCEDTKMSSAADEKDPSSCVQPCQERDRLEEPLTQTVDDEKHAELDGTLKDDPCEKPQETTDGAHSEKLPFSETIGVIISKQKEDICKKDKATPIPVECNDVEKSTDGENCSGVNVAEACNDLPSKNRDVTLGEKNCEEDNWQGDRGPLAKKVKSSAPVQKVYPQVQIIETSHAQSRDTADCKPPSPPTQSMILTMKKEEPTRTEIGTALPQSENSQKGSVCSNAATDEVKCLGSPGPGKELTLKRKQRRRPIHSIPPVPQLIPFRYSNLQSSAPVECSVLGNPFGNSSKVHSRAPGWPEHQIGWQENVVLGQTRLSSMMGHKPPLDQTHPAMKMLQRPISNPSSEKNMLHMSQAFQYVPQPDSQSAPPSYSKAAAFGDQALNTMRKELPGMMAMPQGCFHTAHGQELVQGSPPQFHINSPGFTVQESPHVMAAPKEVFSGSDYAKIYRNGDKTSTGHSLATVESDLEKCQQQYKKLEEIAQTKEKEQQRLKELRFKFARHMRRKLDERQKLLQDSRVIAAKPDYQCFNISPNMEEMDKTAMHHPDYVKSAIQECDPEKTVLRRRTNPLSEKSPSNSIPCPPPAHSKIEKDKHLQVPSTEKWRSPPPAHCQPPASMGSSPHPKHAHISSLIDKTLSNKASMPPSNTHGTSCGTMDSSFEKIRFANRNNGVSGNIFQRTPVKVQRTEAHSSTSNTENGTTGKPQRLNPWSNNGKETSASSAKSSGMQINDIMQRKEQNKASMNNVYWKRSNGFDRSECQVQEALQVAQSKRIQEAQHVDNRIQGTSRDHLTAYRQLMPGSFSAFNSEHQKLNLLMNGPNARLTVPGVFAPEEPPRLVHLSLPDPTLMSCEAKQRQFQYNCFPNHEQRIEAAQYMNSGMLKPHSSPHYMQPMVHHQQQQQLQQQQQILQQHAATTVSQTTCQRENIPYTMRMESNGGYVRCLTHRKPMRGSISHGQPLSGSGTPLTRRQQTPPSSCMLQGKDAMVGFPNNQHEQMQGALHGSMPQTVHPYLQNRGVKEGNFVVPQTPGRPHGSAQVLPQVNRVGPSMANNQNRTMEGPEGQIIKMNTQHASFPGRPMGLHDNSMQMAASVHPNHRQQAMSREHYRAINRRPVYGSFRNGYPNHHVSTKETQQFQSNVNLDVNGNNLKRTPPSPDQHTDVSKDSLNICSVCGKEASFLCSGCKRSWYCSHECQNRDWPIHCGECKR